MAQSDQTDYPLRTWAVKVSKRSDCTKESVEWTNLLSSVSSPCTDVMFEMPV